MEKLAIIGSGISAMTCVHHLKEKYKITIFDKNDYLGGHTHTHQFDGFTLDTGFIVFNEETYTNMLKMFSELGVDKRKSNMSFAVYNQGNGLQYSGSGFGGVFAQKKNLFSPKYWSFLRDINRFFKIALRDRKIVDKYVTIKDYCLSNGLSQFFIDNYIVPMTSAVWSTSHEKIYDFPIALLLPFFFNHGLLGLNKQYQWYTVKGGSDSYIKKIVKGSDLDIHLEESVVDVLEEDGQVTVNTTKRSYRFDSVIMACHSDESLKIVKGLDKEKQELLNAFTYNSNVAILHTDSSIMPPIKKVWSAWNHTIDAEGNASTIYWLNRLQNPDTETDYFVSINPFQDIAKDKIVKELDYMHPLFTTENFALQERLQELNSHTKIYFAGAYFGYGFHEDGVKAGLKVVECLK